MGAPTMGFVEQSVKNGDVTRFVEHALVGISGVQHVAVKEHAPNDLSVLVTMDRFDRTSRRSVAEREKDIFRALPQYEIAFTVVDASAPAASH